ncbi:GvpL/GvpF family gas vesicle protein [Nocardia speluncae]|uniref:GvpL/GvpF family gas vesicle protein n=1 Tax=Nocardia speluncae TaxID=419477 RepID=A0A846XEN4_9NOCA|nr:GvpL/GvpF family gas vesicle protein [Nocardia speluncae]NKY34538.1 GvpL/GvpF family gas vesicle protein [Nocardia speluncae]
MTTDPAGSAHGADHGENHAVYVYGIVPADVEPEARATGIGDPPKEITVVRFGEIGALVSDVPDRPLGTPQDLTAHSELLDGSAAVAPVLPLRFGAVMSDAQAVERELLQPNHDEFRAALHELEGKAQFVVKGRYVEQAILREVLDENAEAARLREQIRSAPEEVTRDARMALGEIIYRSIADKRAADTRLAVDVLASVRPAVGERPPTHDQDAVHLAVLVDLSQRGELEEALAGLTEQWNGRIRLGLLGPMAAYDFVMKREPEG